MKKILLLTLLALTTFNIYAQQGTVTATIVDTDTKEGVAGAVLEIASVKNPEKKKYYTSAYKGVVNIMGLAYGEYSVKISFIGYEDTETKFTLKAAKQNLGNLMLKPSALQIDAVVKTVQSLRTSAKGDTLNYNAGAFKVSSDADVEGLLKKMPGITVADGTVEVQGETVKKVFVDGKEFFNDDVTSAIKSLPAEAVDRIEVYNKLSDQAEFSGMDDGEGYKAINIVTHTNMRQGKFGKVYAGYGYQPDAEGVSKNKYIVGGNVNLFSGSSRLSLIGLFNNVNQQNFSFEDILGVSGSTGRGNGRGMGQYMVRPQSGVASVNALGINYSGSWGKNDKLSLQGSYFFNNTDTKNVATVNKWYESPSPIDTLMTTGHSRTDNYNHRFNARLEWKISKNQSLMIRPGFSFQANDPLSTTLGSQYGESGYSIINNFNDADKNGYNARTFVVYRAKLGKDGRTITVDGNFRYSHNNNNTFSSANNASSIPYDWANPPTQAEIDALEAQNLYQRIIAPTENYSLEGRFSYTEPMSRYSQFSLQYQTRYNYQETDKKSYVTGADYDTTGLTPDTSLSNSYRSGYLTNSVGPGVRFAKDRNTFVASVFYQRSALDGNVVKANEEKIKHSYNNITYSMMGQLNINSQNSLRLYIKSSTENPSVTELQNVFDISNPKYISHGNPNLNPSYSHNVNFHYVNSNIEKGRTFMWMFSMQNTSDYIATHVLYNPSLMIADGGGQQIEYKPLQYTQPENMDGYWSLRTHISYGIPVNFIKCNLNMMAGVNYTITPSIYGGTFNNATQTIENGLRNDTDNIGYDFNAVLGSNISENVDFTFSWSGTYNVATNSAAGNSQKNRYFNHSASATMKLVFWKGFTFTGSASYTQYLGITNDYNDDFLLCNVYLGKKIFRNNRGEISFGVNDVFNQNKAFARTVGSGYTQNSTNSVIGRYYCAQFVYNLRLFGKKGSRNIKDYEGAETQSKDGVGMGRSTNSNRGPRAGGPPPMRGGFGGMH